MDDGFFPESELLASKAPAFISPRCGACGLFKTCKSPKMPVAGRGGKRILIIGEAPGRTEDENNLPFQGSAGQRLVRTARSIGFDVFEDAHVTNALICRPPGNKIPKDVMIDYCRPNVLRAIERHMPHVIIPLGGYAVRSVIGAVWREDPGGIGRWAGFRIPVQRWNAWVCPTYHPSYIERMGDNPDPVTVANFRDHLAAALAASAARPWDPVPDYRRLITVEHNVGRAANRVDWFRRQRRPIAFDFETDRLKPHHPEARIACCSISDGVRTVAYPWHGPAAAATRALLRDPAVPKIGANIKFEQGWCLAVLKTRVAGWLWDVMIAAHCLDARSGVTSVKFQAFVRFGIDDYDHNVRPFLESVEPGGNARNRVRDVDIDHLLLYCGLDSLLEFMVAKQQMQEIGVSCTNGVTPTRVTSRVG